MNCCLQFMMFFIGYLFIFSNRVSACTCKITLRLVIFVTYARATHFHFDWYSEKLYLASVNIWLYFCTFWLWCIPSCQYVLISSSSVFVYLVLAGQFWTLILFPQPGKHRLCWWILFGYKSWIFRFTSKTGPTTCTCFHTTSCLHAISCFHTSSHYDATSCLCSITDCVKCVKIGVF